MPPGILVAAADRSDRQLAAPDRGATIGVMLRLAPVLVLLAACADDPAVERAEYAPDGSLTRAPDELATPNIVLVSLDTLRADYLGTYGQVRPTSPGLDALAQ